MRSFALMAMLVSASLVACVSEGADDGTSDEQDIHATDGGTSTTDASASDGGTSTTDASASDGGVVVTDGGTSTDASADVPTYAEVAPIINSVCGHCHAAKFSTLDKVKANKSRMLSLVASGRMPKNIPGWKDTADGQAVLDFLANSPELQ